VITKINPTRVTIKLNDKGETTNRAFHNVAVIKEDVVEQPNRNTAYGGKRVGKSSVGH